LLDVMRVFMALALFVFACFGAYLVGEPAVALLAAIAAYLYLVAEWSSK
jgi:hypothetical protein